MYGAKHTTTLGVDLAARPNTTGLCVVDWSEKPAKVVRLEQNVDDQKICLVAKELRPVKIAIDMPFGWPLPFISAVRDYAERTAWPVEVERTTLLLRTTDLHVREETGQIPMSVASNLIAICAMRCAGLLALLTDGGMLDRTGAGVVAEVYPAAALRQWGLESRRYKGAKADAVERRAALVSSVADATAPWLELDDATKDRLVASDHLLDALVCAIVGRAIVLGRTLPLPDEHHAVAEKEGWIHVPLREPLSQFDAGIL